MKITIVTFFLSLLAIGAISEAAYASFGQSTERMPVDFYSGHTHDKNGNAVGAPEHSDVTNSAGCHNASVPYLS